MVWRNCAQSLMLSAARQRWYEEPGQCVRGLSGGLGGVFRLLFDCGATHCIAAGRVGSLEAVDEERQLSGREETRRDCVVPARRAGFAAGGRAFSAEFVS